MCIRNVLDGFMAQYWRNQANGGFASHQVADRGSKWFQQTGQSLLLLHPSRRNGEKSISIAIEYLYTPLKLLPSLSASQIFVICCPGSDAKFALIAQTSSRSLARASQVTSQVCDKLQSTHPGPRADCWHSPPLDWPVTRGRGLPVFVTKINKWPAGRQIRQLRSGSNIPALVGSPVDIWYLWSFIVIPHSPGDFIYPIRRVQSGLKLGTHFFGSS